MQTHLLLCKRNPIKLMNVGAKPVLQQFIDNYINYINKTASSTLGNQTFTSSMWVIVLMRVFLSNLQLPEGQESKSQLRSFHNIPE